MRSHLVGAEIEAGFFPLNFVLYLCRPRIEIDGAVHSRPWGTHFFPLAPGEHLIRVYFPYLFLSHCGMSWLRVSIPDGHSVRVRYYFWKPVVFASGSLRQEGPTAVAGESVAEGPVKACPRCAESVRVEAHVCRHCGHEFADADVAQAIASSRAARAALGETRKVSEATGRLEALQRQQLKRAQHGVILTILLVQIGLLTPVVMLTSLRDANPRGEVPAAAVPAMLGIYGVFAFLAVWQWRRAKRMRLALVERAATEGNYFTCVCGEPKKPYYWLHYFLCAIVLVYGYLSLFFKLKSCRKCGRDYASPATAGHVQASGH